MTVADRAARFACRIFGHLWRPQTSHSRRIRWCTRCHQFETHTNHGADR